MKKIRKKIRESVRDFISWLVYWGSIILVISIFIVCALMVGNVIGKHVWIIFVADVVFFYLLWLLFDTIRKRKKNLKKKILVWSIILLFLLIASATLGIAMVTEPRIISNIIIFPIGCFTILAWYITKRRSIVN